MHLTHALKRSKHRHLHQNLLFLSNLLILSLLYFCIFLFYLRCTAAVEHTFYVQSVRRFILIHSFQYSNKREQILLRRKII